VNAGLNETGPARVSGLLTRMAPGVLFRFQVIDNEYDTYHLKGRRGFCGAQGRTLVLF